MRLNKLRLKKTGPTRKTREAECYAADFRKPIGKARSSFFQLQVQGSFALRRPISCGQNSRSILRGIGHLGLKFPSLIKETTRFDFAGRRVVRGRFKIDNRPVWKFGILK